MNLTVIFFIFNIRTINMFNWKQNGLIKENKILVYINEKVNTRLREILKRNLKAKYKKEGEYKEYKIYEITKNKKNIGELINILHLQNKQRISYLQTQEEYKESFKEIYNLKFFFEPFTTTCDDLFVYTNKFIGDTNIDISLLFFITTPGLYIEMENEVLKNLACIYDVLNKKIFECVNIVTTSFEEDPIPGDLVFHTNEQFKEIFCFLKEYLRFQNINDKVVTDNEFLKMLLKISESINNVINPNLPKITILGEKEEDWISETRKRRNFLDNFQVLKPSTSVKSNKNNLYDENETSDYLKMCCEENNDGFFRDFLCSFRKPHTNKNDNILPPLSDIFKQVISLYSPSGPYTMIELHIYNVLTFFDLQEQVKRYLNTRRRIYFYYVKRNTVYEYVWLDFDGSSKRIFASTNPINCHNGNITDKFKSNMDLKDKKVNYELAEGSVIQNLEIKEESASIGSRSQFLKNKFNTVCTIVSGTPTKSDHRYTEFTIKVNTCFSRPFLLFQIQKGFKEAVNEVYDILSTLVIKDKLDKFIKRRKSLIVYSVNGDVMIFNIEADVNVKYFNNISLKHKIAYNYDFLRHIPISMINLELYPLKLRNDLQLIPTKDEISDIILLKLSSSNEFSQFDIYNKIYEREQSCYRLNVDYNNMSAIINNDYTDQNSFEITGVILKNENGDFNYLVKIQTPLSFEWILCDKHGININYDVTLSNVRILVFSKKK